MSIFTTIAASIAATATPDDVRRSSLQQHSVYSPTEAKRLADMIQNQPRSTSATPGTAGIYAYAANANAAMTKRITENREILKIMPEVKQTAAIHRAAIQAPNDLQIMPVRFMVDNPLITESVRGQVQDIISDEIEKHLRLSNVLSGVIYRAFFEVGAECFITLPSSKIDEVLATQIQDRGRPASRYMTATESLHAVMRVSKEIKSHIITNDQDDKNSKIGLECAAYAISNLERNKDTTKLTSAIADFVSPANLKLVDNIDYIRSDILTNAVASERLAQQLVPHLALEAQSLIGNNELSIFNDKGGPSFITSLDGTNTPNSKKVNGEPILLNVPAESLIPITRSGKPSMHEGYLFISDLDGSPFTGSVLSDNGKVSNIGASKVMIGSTTMSRNERFSKINQMISGQGVLGGDNEIVVRAIHKETVKAFLQRKLRDGGLRGISIPERNDIYEYLFYNYMAGQPSRIVFIPAPLVTYLTLNYNPIDGTGDSALESVKDTLVHLMTLRMARLHAATLNAVNRRTINVNFSPKFRGDHVQVMDELVRAHIERSNTTSSFNPNVISQDLVKKAVTVRATGIPGMDGFTAEVAPSESQHSVPDADLAEDLDKTYKAGLFVPAAATNNLSEAEYSKSVVTTNIHYAQVVTDHQGIVCNAITHLCRNTLRYSKSIKTRIMNMLNEQVDNKDGTATKGKSNVIDYDDLVDSVYARLPKPNLPANNLKLEVIPQAISNIASIVESLYPDTLYAGAENDNVQTMQTIRAYVTQMFVRRLLDDIGSTDSLGGFPSIMDIVLEADGIAQQRMSVDSINTAISAVSALAAKLKENAGITPPADSGMGSSDGGYDSGTSESSDTGDMGADNTTETGGIAEAEAEGTNTQEEGNTEEPKAETAEEDTKKGGDAFDQVDKLNF